MDDNIKVTINGLDVSKCDFLTKDLRCNCVDVFMYEKYKYMNNKSPKCNGCKDCYYKQNLVLNEENKDLSWQLSYLKNQECEIEQLKEKLKVSVEELKYCNTDTEPCSVNWRLLQTVKILSSEESSVVD